MTHGQPGSLEPLLRQSAGEVKGTDDGNARDVIARGARVRFASWGTGPPLVLIHDFLSSHLEWDDVVPALAARLHVIAIDLPGFGESEAPDPSKYRYGFDGFAESVADLAAALGPGRISICGRGMGGSIAMTLAANHPDLVDRLVLVAPHVYPTRRVLFDRLAEVPLVGPLLFKQLYGRGFLRSYLGGSRAGRNGTAAARVERHLGRFDAPSARQAGYATLLAMLDPRPVAAKVPRVLSPALVIWGRDDTRAPMEHGRRLARELQRARLEVVESGHSPAEECPSDFVRLVIEFLSDPRRSTSQRPKKGMRPPRTGA